MGQTAQDAGNGDPLEMVAGLTFASSDALDLANPEAPADQLVERDPLDDEVAPRLLVGEIDAARPQLGERLGLDQREVAAAARHLREGADAAGVAVALQATLDRVAAHRCRPGLPGHADHPAVTHGREIGVWPPDPQSRANCSAAG